MSENSWAMMKNKKITNINVLFYQLWQLWHVQVHLWQLQQLWHVHWTLNIIQVHLWHPGYPQAAGGKDRTVSNSIKDDTTWNINWNHTHQPTHLLIDRILFEMWLFWNRFHDREASILYPSCFDANAGLFEQICGPEVVLWCTLSLCHLGFESSKYQYKDHLVGY